MPFMEKASSFISKVLTANGGISFGRLSSFILMVVCVTWDTAYLTFNLLHWKTLFPMGVTIHDVLPPVATLLGQTTFFNAPYLINKGANLMAPATPENGQ